MFCVLLFGLYTYNLSGDPTLEHATYNWPCEKQDSCKFMPHFLNVCPCDLFTVILNANLIGNWSLLKLNGISVLINGILGINTIFPLSLPVIILASIILFLSCLTHRRVPLHNFGESKFLNKMIGDPTFNFKQWSGIPGTFNEFKNSVG